MALADLQYLNLNLADLTPHGTANVTVGRRLPWPRTSNQITIRGQTPPAAAYKIILLLHFI